MGDNSAKFEENEFTNRHFPDEKLIQNYIKIKPYPMKMGHLKVQDGANNNWYITPMLE